MSYPEEKRCVYYLEVVPKSPGFGVRWHRIGMSTLPLRSYFAHRSSCFTLLCASVSSFVLRAKWDYEMVSWVQKPHHSETSFEIHMLAWRLPIACLHPRYKFEVMRLKSCESALLIPIAHSLRAMVRRFLFVRFSCVWIWESPCVSLVDSAF